MQNTLREMRRRWYCYAMMSGTIVLLVVFAYYPAFSAFYHSFTLWDGYRPARWAGLQNYNEVFSKTIYWTAFQNMILLSVWMVIRAATFPLLGAALIYRLKSERWAYFFRLMFVLPLVVPSVVAILIWRQLYEPNIGFFNEILMLFGMEPLGWLNDPDMALGSLMFVGFPWIDGVGMLIYLAGLLAIPNEVVEAAIVDGASSWRRFYSIELPLVLPQVRLIVILNIIGSLQDFGWQLLVTRGGPVHATTVPAWQMYHEAILSGRYGIGSAIGVLLFIGIFVLTLINQTSIRNSVEYEAS